MGLPDFAEENIMTFASCVASIRGFKLEKRERQALAGFLALALVQISEPAPFVLPIADVVPPSLAWRPSQPRGPPLFV